MNMTPKMEEEVLAVLRQPMDDVVGWVCHALETIFNGVMEVEAQRLTRRRSGKGPALDHRSGFYTRTYPSPFGALELKEPRLRRSPFASALLACFEARQKKVKELVTAMHHEGRFQSCAVHLQRRVLQSTQLRHRKGLANSHAEEDRLIGTLRYSHQ